MILVFTLIIFILSNCNPSISYKPNPVEIELNQIEKGESISSLKQASFSNFIIDWTNFDQYESNCFSYLILPIVDTLKQKYTIDICYDKFNWWDSYDKTVQNFDSFQLCKNRIENYSLIDDSLENIKFNFYRNKTTNEVYYLSCTVDHLVSYQTIDFNIDFESLHEVGEFIKDDNHVFSFYDTSDGIQIYILDQAHAKSFTGFKYSIYGKDNNHIFDLRHGIIEEADVKSFEVIIKDSANSISAIGKDINQYYYWDEIITDKSEIDELLK